MKETNYAESPRPSQTLATCYYCGKNRHFIAQCKSKEKIKEKKEEIRDIIETIIKDITLTITNGKEPQDPLVNHR